MDSLLLKCTHIEGLSEFVIAELREISNIQIESVGLTEVYCSMPINSDISVLYSLKTVVAVYVLVRDTKYNPGYISNHKSILGNLIEFVLAGRDAFISYRLSCAGSDSPEVSSIEKYIQEHYKIQPAADADLEIAIGKVSGDWELSVRITSRPLSVRDYRVANIPGGMNPTIAYALNSLCRLDSATSYLNICSGSGTLLIEAGLAYPDLRLVGFDIDGKHNALAVQNIKKAGLIKSVQLKTADIMDAPELGKFDVIVADLPFGMQIGKDSDLGALYQSFVNYCEQNLVSGGRLAVYTTEHELFRGIVSGSQLHIVHVVDLKVVTSINSYIYPQIVVCEK